MFRPNDDHNQNSWFDAAEWMKPKTREKLMKSWAPIFYEHVFCNIDEGPFSVLYGTMGKPNFPVNILLSLEYIKHMKDCSDLEILDAFNFDYLVNYALGIKTLGSVSLSPRTFYYFRERIYLYYLNAPEKADLLFKQFVSLVRTFAREAGLSTEEQRIDTTLFMSNIRKAGRLSLACDVLAKSVKAIPESFLTESLLKVLQPDFKTDVLYRSKAKDGDSRLKMILDLCIEALGIMESIPGRKSEEELRILRRFVKEQTTQDESGVLAPKPKGEISASSLQSAYDEDATFRSKGNIKQSGYIHEVTETCNPANAFQIITDYDTRPNTASDVTIIKERMGAIRKTGCTDVYADGAFNSQEVHDTAEENGIRMHLTNMNGKEAYKKLPVTDFELDDTCLIKKCPSGKEPLRAAIVNSQSTAHFSREACSGCPLFEQCYSKQQRKDYAVRLSIKAIKSNIQRKAMEAGKKENTSLRAGIEGTCSALKRKGLAKLKVCGRNRVRVVSAYKAMAQNIRRMIKYLQGGYKPKAVIPSPNRAILLILS